MDFAAVKRVLDKVSRARELQERIDALRAELGRLGGVGRLIGASAAMQKVYGLMLRAPRGAVILVLGERGTGKELVALTLHELSERRDRPFVPVECSAISPSLVENELFGDERSSYKDVDRAGGSYFEQAHRGTLFLDEISELPLPLQAKLLRVIMTGAIPRADGVRIRVDVRVIAASSRRLEEAVEAGAFRASLLYEINAFPIHLPPLRERKEDIELLAQYFLGQLNREHGTAKPFTPAAIERLRGFSWPGNVPHLRSVVHKAFLLSENGIDALTIVLPQEPTQFPIFPASRRDFERRYTVWTLEQCGGDKKRTAEMLGISLKTLYNWLKKYRSE